MTSPEHDGEADRLGTWARRLLRAPATRPGDEAERAADRGGEAARRGEAAAPARSAGRAPDTGTPPWGAGRPLHETERAAHERALGADLGEVRVHEGPAAGRWAQALGARAFAFGRDVVLGPGEYAAGTDTGRHLLGHELTHVVASRGRATPVLARVTLSTADVEAIADSLHAAITDATADEELIYVALQKLERDTTAIATLRTTYQTRHSANLETALRGRLTGGRLGFALALLGVTRGARSVPTAPPSTTAQFETLARTLRTALTARTVDAEAVYAALLPLERDPTRVSTLKAAYTRLFTTTLDAEITTSALNATDRSYALYLLNAPRAATPASSSNIPTAPSFGATATTTTVTGGTVSADTAVPWTNASGRTGQFTFGYGYSGGLTADTRWLQAIYREILVTDAQGSRALSDTVTIGSRTYGLTTNRTTPNYSIDSDRPSTPFFDEAHPGESFRDASSVSTFDSPSPIQRLVAREFAAGATSVVSRAHFDVFLVRDFAPIHHFEVEVTWTFTAVDRRTTNRRVIPGGPVTALPTAIRSVLVRDYPAFAYLR